MNQKIQLTHTFPSVSIPTLLSLPNVDVSLIAQLGHGAGDGLYYATCRRQAHHPHFVNALDEPSAKLGGTDFAKGDMTSVYSFLVGPAGHPFHSHAGHRVFTAVAGSSGTLLRFSSATMAEIEQDPAAFLRQLHHVHLPPDALFTVRFPGNVWHQFLPLAQNRAHPAFVAISCHTNELGGLSRGVLADEVLQNQASIASLTQLLPQSATQLLDALDAQSLAQISTTYLAIDAVQGSAHRFFCNITRRFFGRWRGRFSRLRLTRGFISHEIGAPK